MYDERATVRDMKENLKMHSFRLPERLSVAVQRFADKARRSESDVVRAALAEYIGKPTMGRVLRRGRSRD
jgi:hypothetical protein